MHCSSFSIPLRSTISGNNRNKEHTKPLTSRLPQLPFFAAFPFSGSLPQSPEERQHKKERVASAAVFTSDMGHRSAYPQTQIQLTSRELPNYLCFLRSLLFLFSLATPPPPSFFLSLPFHFFRILPSPLLAPTPSLYLLEGNFSTRSCKSCSAMQCDS